MRWALIITLLASTSWAGRAPLSEYRRRAASVKADDTRGQFILALWCAQKGMRNHAWKHHAIVLDIQPGHRASLRALKRLQPDPRALVRDVLYARKTNVREGAVRALRRTRRPAALFLPALRSKSERTRSRAIRALGLLGDERAVVPLIRHLAVAGGNTTGAHISTGGQISYVRDFDVEVA